MRFFPFNWYNKFGTIPSSYREAMSYEEQILWLCQQIENLKAQSGNFNYNLLVNKPQINGVTLEGNLTSSQLGIDNNYNYLINKPQISGNTLYGNKSYDELGIQQKLEAGQGIRIVGNVIYATGGGSGGSSDYSELSNKPKLNGLTIEGDKTAFDYKVQSLLEVPVKFTGKNTIVNIASYQEGSVIPYNLPLLATAHSAYATFEIFKDDYLLIEGKVDVYKISKDHELQTIYTTGDEPDTTYFKALSDGYIVINCFDMTGEFTTKITEYKSGEQLEGEHKLIRNKLNSMDKNLDTFLDYNFPREKFNPNDFVNGYFQLAEPEFVIGSSLPSYTYDTSHKFAKIQITDNILFPTATLSTLIRLKGKCINHPMWFTTEELGNEEIILSCSELNIDTGNNLTFFETQIPKDATYLYVQFSNVDTLPPELYTADITQISGSGSGNYQNLSNKPLINGETLEGDHDLTYYGLAQNGGVTVTDGGLLTNSDSRHYFTNYSSNTAYDFSNVTVGNVASSIPTVASTNSKRIKILGQHNVTLNFYGDYEFVVTDYYSDVVLDKVRLSGEPSKIFDHYELPSRACRIYMNFYNTTTVPYLFCDVFDADKIRQQRDKLVTYTQGHLTKYDKMEIVEESYYDIDGLVIGDTFDPTDVASETYSARTLVVTSEEYYPNEMELRLQGKGTVIFTDFSNEIIGFQNFETSGSDAFIFPMFDSMRIYVNFEQTNTYTPNAYFATPFRYSENYPYYTILKDNLTFNSDGTTNLNLKTGYYYIQGGISYFDGSINTTWLEALNSVIYYDTVAGSASVCGTNITPAYTISSMLIYNSGTTSWLKDDIKSTNIIRNETGSSSQLKTSIPDSGSNNDVANIEAVRNYVANNIEHYNLTEERIGTWTDGKPIYRKTFNFGALPNNGFKNINHDISNIDIFTSIRGIANRPASGGTNFSSIPIPYSSNNFVEIYATDTILEIHTSSDRSAYNGYVTLEYTKTTD